LLFNQELFLDSVLRVALADSRNFGCPILRLFSGEGWESTDRIAIRRCRCRGAAQLWHPRNSRAV